MPAGWPGTAVATRQPFRTARVESQPPNLAFAAGERYKQGSDSSVQAAGLGPQLKRNALGGNCLSGDPWSPPVAKTVSDYIRKAPPAARRALRVLRTAIKAGAPGVTERISYRIPTFDLDGRYLLYIAAFKDHVSIYPVTAGMVARYGQEIARFRSGKGTLRFPLDAPIPTALVRKLAKVRVQERRAARR